MYHIFFIHLSVIGHLGCFHVLSLVLLTQVGGQAGLTQMIGGPAF